MSEESTQNFDGGRSFEERVFARFDAVDLSIGTLDARVQNLEARSFDTKPIWERALAEILETKKEVSEMRRELSATKTDVGEMRRELAATKRTLIRRMDQVMLTSAESRADLQDVVDRVEKLGPPPSEGENSYD